MPSIGGASARMPAMDNEGGSPWRMPSSAARTAGGTRSPSKAAHVATRPKGAQPPVRYGHSATAHERPPAPPTGGGERASRYSRKVKLGTFPGCHAGSLP
jgi:hypothetical protein